MNQPVQNGQHVGLLAAAHDPARSRRATHSGAVPALAQGNQYARKEAMAR
ncbi:hypothetical protein ACWGH2_05050 [Streptomyces sp. NPDC054871]